jgi:hypothetical protein
MFQDGVKNSKFLNILYVNIWVLADMLYWTAVFCELLGRLNITHTLLWATSIISDCQWYQPLLYTTKQIWVNSPILENAEKFIIVKHIFKLWFQYF